MASFGYKVCRIITLLACLLGIVVSLYAFYVETSKERDSSFQAACDFSSTISCSKVFTSKYGRGFGLLEHVVGAKHWMNQPNSVFGLAFYTLLAFLAIQSTVDSAMAQLVFTVVSNLMSVYLACVLYFILEDLCVVCVTTYMVNAVLMACSIYKISHLPTTSKPATSKPATSGPTTRSSTRSKKTQ